MTLEDIIASRREAVSRSQAILAGAPELPRYVTPDVRLAVVQPTNHCVPYVELEAPEDPKAGRQCAIVSMERMDELVAWWLALRPHLLAAAHEDTCQDSNTGINAIIGRWPGDETDEEVERAMR